MNNSVTSVTHEGWFTRIKNSVIGVLVGVVLIPASIGVLAWNEHRTVHRTRGLNEGAEIVQTVSDPNTRNPELDKKLVHMTGIADTEEVLRDKVFQIEERSIQLVRHVEMYQWIETEHTETRKKVGGGKTRTTTYEYQTDWAPGRIDSDAFHEPNGHQNPSECVSAASHIAKHVHVGAFEVSENLKSQIDAFETIPWTDQAHAKLDPRVAKLSAPDGEFLYVSRKGTQGAATPSLGDQRVRIEVVRPTQVSLVAMQSGDRLEGYTVSNDENIERLYVGEFSAVEVFQRLQDENRLLAWILRAAGSLFCFLGFAMVLAPLAVFADVIPIFGSLTRGASILIAFSLAVCVSATTIAVAWITVRPLIAVPLLALSVASIVYLFYLRKKKRKHDPPTRPKSQLNPQMGGAQAI